MQYRETMPHHKDQASITETASNRKRAAIIIASLSCFNNPFWGSSVTVALPSIGQEFQMGPVLLGWISTSFLLTVAPLMIPFGRLGDIHGRKTIFLGGVYILLGTLLLNATSHSGRMIIFYRAIQGIASAMMSSTVIPMVVAAVPLNERGHVLGIVTAMTYFGLSTGPFLGGIITHYLGWRFIFWFSILLSLVLLFIAHFMLEGDWKEAKGEKFDVTGAMLLGCGLLAMMYGFSTMPSIRAAFLVAAGILCLICFVLFEIKVTYPIVDINLFRHNNVFAYSNLAALINYASTFAVAFLLSLYLQQVKAMTPQYAGLILVTQPVVQALFSPLTGRMSDRIEPRLLASWGMTCTFIGLIMLIFLDAGFALSYILICLMIHGFGFALFSSPNTNAVMSSVERHVYGVASATLSTMRQVGMTLSMGIVMMTMSMLLGTTDITPAHPREFIESMRISFAIFALLCFGGIFASMARGTVNK